MKGGTMKALLIKPAKKRLYPRLTDVYAYEWNGNENAFAHPLNWPPPFLISDRRLEYTPTRGRILVVMDMPRAAVPNFPSEYACDVFSGPEALEALKQKEYDVVVLFYSKLVRNVLEVVKALKVLCPHVPVMVLAGEASGELVVEAFRCGAEDCLVGNVGEDLLRERVVKLLEVGRNYSDVPHAGVRKAVELIHREYRRKLSLDEMAEVACMSRRHFSRTFRKVMGVCPWEYLNKVRIDRAKCMLRQGRPIAEVALEVGFQSISHFYEIFKKFEGISPGAYCGGKGCPNDDKTARIRHLPEEI
ncbi:MAG: hypothetical protein DRN68_01465 [Thaumarchaeota archaeon]|nr:MAG: hypothetical protein DRN68_01465 [Nitrososphaerota archaeon]